MLLNSEVEAALQRHGYATLPAALEDTRLAVSHHWSNGIFCVDVLAYREVNGRGETLRDEAAFLVEALPRISQQLSRRPNFLSPDFQTRIITFLGKKVCLLVEGDGRLLRCRLFPLLILSPTTPLSVATDHPAPGLPAVPSNQLDQYMLWQRHTTSPQRSAIDAWLLHLRRAHQLLGGVLFTFLPLLGLTILFASLGWFVGAAFIFLAATLCPLALLLRALRHFGSFKNGNPSGVLIDSGVPSLTSACSMEKSQVPPICLSSTLLPQDEDEKTARWTAANTAAFLLDSMESAMTACLSTYQGANLRAYAAHLTGLLTNGIRLAALKRTGQVPSQPTVEILDQLSATNARDELNAWLQRLAVARRLQPLTTTEAQQVGHFAVRLLHQLDALPPTWEAQILRILPRVLPTPPLTPGVSSTRPTEAAVPLNLDPRRNPAPLLGEERKAAMRDAPNLPEQETTYYVRHVGLGDKDDTARQASRRLEAADETE